MNNLKIIVISGLPGSGKSTLAEGIARKLHIPVFSVDPIDSAIIRSGINKSFKTGFAAYLVAETLADEQLKLGNTVLIDAVNAEEEGKAMWRKLAKNREAKLIIIECVLADKKLHRSRVKSRIRNLHGLPEISWSDVEARRKKYTKWSEPTLQLDTSNERIANLQQSLEYIQSA